jgi:23S rRNA (guanosine2251-2'-O)-methyltransferase
MAGNSQRRGARRTAGSKKGQTSGTGGQGRRRLRGKGPTPKAQERTGHPAARRARPDRTNRSKSPSRSKPAGTSPRGRDGDGPEVVAGRNAVVEALRAAVPATALYVAERIDSDDRVKEALRLAVDSGVPVLEGPRPEIDRLTAGAVHQGLALQVPPYTYAHPDDLLARVRDSARTPLIVALDGVTDPRNLGAVVRSTAAFGGTGVVVPQRRAAGMSVGAWKASAGAAARLPVARATNLTRTLDSYKDAGLFVVGLTADGDVALPDLEAAIDPLVLVVGSEGRGLSRLVARSCDLLVRIPIDSGTESLNAGVAAGVALYEISRRRSAR